MTKRNLLVCLIVFAACLPLFSAEPKIERYALIMADAPLAQLHTRYELKSFAAAGHRQTIEAAQATVRGEVQRRGMVVTGAVQNVLNAVFVQAPKDRLTELQSLPGVQVVVRLRRVRPLLDAAVQLVNAPAAWAAVGGVQNAGRGIKIAIIDTGIDQNHAAFQDAALPMPAGFPKCTVQEYCAFTNNKVIVARSYVSQPGSVDPTQSHPDDPTPRDRIGHGTATAMVAAGETNTGPSATITGMAPKAYLGNYKVFGSSFNPFATDQGIIQAIDDALADGMDIASLSFGGVALGGPLDQGALCGNPAGTFCDLEAAAVENAIRAGMTVVAAAGNEGDVGLSSTQPTYNTIDSPGYSPSAIAVGAITNSHTWQNELHLPGTDVPSNLQNVAAQFGDGPLPTDPLTAPGVDVTKTGNNGFACAAMPNGSLSGEIALIERGSPPSGPTGCTFEEKVTNAQTAGAAGVVIYDNVAGEAPVPPGGLTNTTIPTLMIGNADGIALKQFLDAHPRHAMTIDPNLVSAVSAPANQVVSFSSRGPATGTGAIKPEVLAVGTDLYMATESTDPTGDLYSANGYFVANGTSFSTPMVAGAAALVKQKNQGFTPGEIKSAVVNTANSSSLSDELGNALHITDMGAGKLDAGAAVSTNVTIQPSTLSFGFIGGNFPSTQKLTITNTGATKVNLGFSFSVLDADTNGKLSLDKNTMALNAGQSGTLTVTLGGARPAPGLYDGFLTIQGGNTALNVPYLYVVGNHTANDIFTLLGDQNDGTVGQSVPDGALAFKLVDQFGAPVIGVPVQFNVVKGGGSIQQPDSVTDADGIAFAGATYGSQAGDQMFSATAAGLTVTFSDTARVLPVIKSGGAVNAASFQVGQGVAPGSYITLFGTGLSDDTGVADTVSLPLSIHNVSVSFDVPSTNISVAGRLYYVSPIQVNVFVPWELQGQSSAVIKINISETSGQTYNLPLATYSPAFFAYSQGGQELLAALDTSNKVITPGNAAVRGQVVELFANGLGPVKNQPATGEPAPSTPPATTETTPTVTIGGADATVQFSGLAPGFAGLYQLNVVVPASINPGIQPVIVKIGGISSPAVNLPVK
jgi:minor extracellular serine protease Vpr